MISDRGPIDNGWLMGMIFLGKIGKAIDCLMKTGWPARQIVDKLEEYRDRGWALAKPGSLWEYSLTPRGEDELMRLVPQSKEAVRAVKDKREFGIVRGRK